MGSHGESLRGRPRTRSVDSSPSCFAVCSVQNALPYGLPLFQQAAEGVVVLVRGKNLHSPHTPVQDTEHHPSRRVYFADSGRQTALEAFLGGRALIIGLEHCQGGGMVVL